MEHKTAWPLANVFVKQLIEYKGKDTAMSHTDLTHNQWNDLVSTLSKMPMMTST